MYCRRHITVVIPAYNEELSIARVLTDILALVDMESRARLVDQLIVCDNASTDNTAKIARSFCCDVVFEGRRGYGAACQAALRAAGDRSAKDIVVFVDADGSVVAGELYRILEPLTQHVDLAADLVIGSRSLGQRQPGALSLPQRFGNRLATTMIRMFWRVSLSDLGPFRAITWGALERIQMQDRKFGWTVEMQVRAIQEGLSTEEVAVTTRKRIGKSKISGTLSGVVGAGMGIIGTILRLWWTGAVGSPDHPRENHRGADAPIHSSNEKTI